MFTTLYWKGCAPAIIKSQHVARDCSLTPVQTTKHRFRKTGASAKTSGFFLFKLSLSSALRSRLNETLRRSIQPTHSLSLSQRWNNEALWSGVWQNWTCPLGAFLLILFSVLLPGNRRVAPESCFQTSFNYFSSVCQTMHSLLIKKNSTNKKRANATRDPFFLINVVYPLSITGRKAASTDRDSSIGKCQHIWCRRFSEHLMASQWWQTFPTARLLCRVRA